MIDPALAAHYEALERDFNVVEMPELGNLMVPNGNGEQPFHRWFHMKEGYSADLLPVVLELAGLDTRSELSILDPFAGGGTTLISAGDWASAGPPRGIRGVGIERNPFLHFLGSTKVAAFLSPNVEIAPLPSISSSEKPEIPALSTFQNHDFFDQAELDDLFRLREAVNQIEPGLTRSLQLLALATSVEPISRLRRDGRTLRRAPEKQPDSILDVASARLKLMREDLKLRAAVGDHEVQLALFEDDARSIDRSLPVDFDADITVCSPPYPNNIDYTEVYKLEAWFLGSYNSNDDFRAQRHKTFRSHPSVVFDEPAPSEREGSRAWLENLIQPVVNAVPIGRYKLSRERLIRGYVEDITETLTGCYLRTKPGGWMAVIVGNSLHGGSEHSLLVAADLLIASAGESVGWEVDRIAVGRRPRRRGTEQALLRESMVLLRRPA